VAKPVKGRGKGKSQKGVKKEEKGKKSPIYFENTPRKMKRGRTKKQEKRGRNAPARGERHST